VTLVLFIIGFLGTRLALQKRMKIFFISIILVLIAFLGPKTAVANIRCEEVFSPHPSISRTTQTAKPTSVQKPTNTWEEFYKKTDLSPLPALWLRIRQSLEKHVTQFVHPLELAGTDPNKIGAVYKSMILELPILRTLIEAERLPRMSHADFIKLKRIAANEIIRVARQPKSELQVFAALEALKYISTIESRVEFPRTQEDIEKETKRQEDEKKKQEQKDKQKKDKKDEPEDDEPPKWNKTDDQYKPENKDLASESGGKKKSADILMTDADVPKRLLRQKIYDQFDFHKWSTNPVQRETLQRESTFSKKMIIDPLGESEVDVPVPYGYTLIPGKYKGYQIREIGPGEFKLHLSANTKVTLGLSKVLSEPHRSGLAKSIDPNPKLHWPKHLLTFTESLRGLSALEAAARLEKYVAEDGGFLYYSKGDKIDEHELSKIDQKMSSLLSSMPKPMAMANAGAFNCDGAAWIGALLLRDVLGHQVRIAGGRTSAGLKTIENDRFHVVRSSDPAHAWLEVYDGTQWKPFDMTPKNNTPDSESAPSDLEREGPQDQKPPPKQQDQQSEQKSKSESQPQDQEKQDAESKEGKEKDQKDQGKEDSHKKDQDGKEKHSENETSGDVETQKIEDLIKAKSTQRQKDEAHLQLIDKVLKRNELMLLEHLINDGYQTKFVAESTEIVKALGEHSNWKNPAERSAGKISTLINEAKFSKFEGLNHLLNEIRVDFGQNKARDARQKLMIAERLLITLSDYRNLTKAETEALTAIQKIISELNQIKHKNSKEFDVVDDLLKNLPGNISKDWVRRQYGKDFDQLGSSANQKLAQDLTSGKLKPLLQMGAVSEFVDMTLNSSQEPQWKDEPTLNRSIVPKPRQDLIVTRNPLDFAKMLWNLRPGENMFAPTLQGRQFAMGSLETRRVPNPKNPIERKVSVVYYDISGSMSGHPLETVDALLMAFADNALSEVDAIGRPTHEIYLIPFDDKIYEGVHISSKEDAQNFLAKKMNMRTNAAGGTDIQKVIENFYSLISSSFYTKSNQGREKLFKKANMVLFSDGGSQIDMQRIEEARKKIPSQVQINMNFVSIGDQVNETLKTLSTNEKLSSTKPTFRQMDSAMINSVVSVSTKYDPEAFATTEKISGRTLALINEQIQKINIDPRLQARRDQVDRALSQIQITKTDVSKLSGLREILNLQRLETVIDGLNINQVARQRIVEAVVDSYQHLSGRNWKDMTYDEKEAFDKLKRWAHN
jgi:uncharacterized protein YegL